MAGAEKVSARAIDAMAIMCRRFIWYPPIFVSVDPTQGVDDASAPGALFTPYQESEALSIGDLKSGRLFEVSEDVLSPVVIRRATHLIFTSEHGAELITVPP